MKKVVNWLRGTVTIQVEGPFLERYFNICAAAGIGFWAVRQLDGERAEVTLSRWDLCRAEALGEKALCTVQLVAEAGLPAFLRRFRWRYGMAAGALLVVFLLTVVSRFVLVVEVEGNETVSRSAILAQLQNHGFGVGSYGPDVDVRELSNQVLLDMKELSFLTVNITGIRATVIVRETDPVPEIVDENAIADVAAARDGVIVDMDVMSGRPVVSEGQAVLEGEVLISSLLVNEMGDGSGEVYSSRQIRARGEVWATTQRTLSAATPLQALQPDRSSGGQSGLALEILGRRFNFYRNSSNLDTGCDKIAILYPITLPGGEALPFGLWQLTWQNWRSEPASVNRESAEQFLQGLLTRRLETLLGEGEILSAQWQTEERDGAITVTLTAQCLEQIGRTVELEQAREEN